MPAFNFARIREDVMESEATKPEACAVKAEPESEPTVQTPQPIVAVDGQPDENETPSSTLDKLQAVVREKTGILQKLSTLEKEEAPLKQRLFELRREKGKMHERLRELANHELSSLPPATMDSPRNADVSRRTGPFMLINKTPRSVQKRRKTHSGAEWSGSMPKRAKRATTEASLTFKQLQDFVDDLKQQGYVNERCIIQNNFDAFNALCRT